ncbi:MAG: ATP-binding cassette domain-containing protein [Chitinophagales bacterium]|nr:ATP-binding cassette domain-containing protein [Chitinophagales bacterium]MDW8418051.1 ATP-binding cassette domain-containing protein [Chitinophagales bacterium]
MIEIKNITKSFGKQQVLKGVSAVFDTGKCNLIIGKSGSGKTVTLKCMVGLFEPDSGSIEFDGRNITAMNFKERKEVRREIGMLFQGTALFDSMTVEENVRFPLDMFTSQSESEKRDRVNFCLKRVNMENTNKKYPGELSGGMKKRVGIARAIVMNPKYLFCDEPNSGLDPKTALIIDHLIQEITQEYQMTTVINTHDMNSVMGIGDKVIFLHEGLKYWEGTNKEILSITEGELFDFIFASDFLKDLRRRAKF